MNKKELEAFAREAAKGLIIFGVRVNTYISVGR